MIILERQETAQKAEMSEQEGNTPTILKEQDRLLEEERLYDKTHAARLESRAQKRLEWHEQQQVAYLLYQTPEQKLKEQIAALEHQLWIPRQQIFAWVCHAATFLEERHLAEAQALKVKAFNVTTATAIAEFEQQIREAKSVLETIPDEVEKKLAKEEFSEVEFRFAKFSLVFAEIHSRIADLRLRIADLDGEQAAQE